MHPRGEDLVQTRQHGGLAQFMAQLPTADGQPLSNNQVLDFSVNINPYGPSPEMIQALRNCDSSHYPEPQAESLKLAIGQHYAMSKQQDVIIGNGAADLMWSYCQAKVTQASRVLMLEPTFSEFRYACQRYNAQILVFRAKAEQGFAWHYQQIEQLIEQHNIDHLYLCHPNSPTGIGIDLDWLTWIANKYPALTIVLDLAFAKLSPYHQDTELIFPDNIIRLFSLTKDHSIPGVRLGFAIAPISLIERLEQQRPSWSINAFAMVAGRIACHESQFVAASRQRIHEDQQNLIERLGQLNISYHSAAAPMILIRTGNGQLTQQQLWQRQILVRDCASYDLPEWIRIFPRPAADADILLAALKKG